MNPEDQQNVQQLRSLRDDERWLDEPYVQRARSSRRSWRTWLPVPIAAAATLAIVLAAVALTRPAGSPSDGAAPAASRAAALASRPAATASTGPAASPVVPWAPLVAPPAKAGASPAADGGPLSALTITMQLPATLRAGATADYTVRLTNPTRAAIALTPCPTYTQIVQGAPQSAQNRPSAARFRLNCASTGSLAAGDSVLFAMRVAVPADARGAIRVTWALESAGAPSATETTSVTP